MYELATPTELQQGVIAEEVYFYGIDRSTLSIALTPACDFEQGKVELITFCAVLEAGPVLKRLVANHLTDGDGNPTTRVSNNKLGKIRSTIESLIKRRILRYHWLAPLPDSETPLIADFTILNSIALAETGDLTKVARLSSPYKEEVAARYAAYLGRVGIPDFTDEQFQTWMDHTIHELLPDQVGGQP